MWMGKGHIPRFEDIPVLCELMTTGIPSVRVLAVQCQTVTRRPETVTFSHGPKSTTLSSSAFALPILYVRVCVNILKYTQAGRQAFVVRVSE